MEPVSQKVQNLFVKNGWMLSLAESCTGGGLAEMLVRAPDCSNYFLGSIVTYSNLAKRELLGVRQESLEAYGAVSEQVAEEMAKGAISRFHSDFAIAVTGIAGPGGGSLQKPVGTVCFAIASKAHAKSWTSFFKGGRVEVMESASAHALEHLFMLLNGGYPVP